MQPLAKFRFRATGPVTIDEAPAFAERAPFRTDVVYDFPTIDPDALWRIISSDRMWSWLPTVWGCRYPDGEEIGPGTVRDFQMFVHHWLVYAQREQLLAWEPGRRIAYTATDATLPFFGTWFEDYRVEPRADGGSRLRWTMAVQVRFLGRLPLRWISPLFALIFRFGLRGLPREYRDGLTSVTERAL
ncbi:hypothetical protein GOARA_012_00200 [Gordonia araii NBRC 100433]|uniref:Coenzyme Q-binding protein COQ10 START domain-containing protein n=1 Tax=Gordonia araii NBRC 100433 TaxID=1073574 RepID=G7GXZ5_9ACTN|nr:SRPBCC family protein [Gordonia araii]NNG98082.1 SRPBCC family protein [Gordonia araii NBRC 100433]GAB08470.1 hypothetical protein GOARA_012_00200 [Gordonia araii NBRC 100433]